MFGYISGEIAEINGGNVVVDVGGVGYELAVSSYTLADCRPGQKKRFYTYMQVREDGISLFGFADTTERNMFLNLISVSGVGCKMAQAVLSGMDSASLAAAIFREDAKSLTKIKGLGKKTAERIVLELKEKVDAEAAEAAGATQENAVEMSKDMQDAIAILCSLGKNRSEAEKLAEAAGKLGAVTAKELVNMALRIG